MTLDDITPSPETRSIMWKVLGGLICFGAGAAAGRAIGFEQGKALTRIDPESYNRGLIEGRNQGFGDAVAMAQSMNPSSVHGGLTLVTPQREAAGY